MLRTLRNRTRAKIEALHSYSISKLRGIATAFASLVDILTLILKPSLHLLKIKNSNPSLRPLTPILLADHDIELFERELLGALSGKTGALVRNIAVSGGYSVGKSSHLLTFKSRHSQFKYVTISLAKFLNAQNHSEAEDQPVSEGKQVESPGILQPQPVIQKVTERKKRYALERIEESIAQQLLYSAKSSNLPRSRLKRISDIDKKHVLAYSLLAISTMFSILFIFFDSFLQKYAGFIYDNPYIMGMSLYSYSMIFIIVSIFILLWKSIRLIGNSSFDRLTIKSGKVEFENHGSVLHKYLDEIVYYFERTNTDVVIFEDMDRFDEIEVFNSLREINSLLNNSEQISRPIFFIYAIKDSLFTARERTKFFDLILPIIPVVNFSNSKEKLKEHLKKINFYSTDFDPNDNVRARLSASLVETISLYVDDMRLITNIVNEFHVYSSRLRSSLNNLNSDKLFTMVFIKNYYPKLYAEFIERQGPLFKIFKKVSEYKADNYSKLTALIEECKGNLIELDKCSSVSIEEIKAQFWYLICHKQGVFTIERLKFNRETVMSYKSFICEDVSYMENSILSYSESHNGHFVNCAFTLSEVKNSYGQSLSKSLSKRREIESWDRKVLNDNIVKYNHEIDMSNNAGISYLITQASIRKDIEALLGVGYEAIIYFLASGFLDEDYDDYVSFFYEGSLSTVDKNSLLKLRQKEYLDVSHSLSKPSSFVAELNLNDIYNGRGLFIGLISYLLGMSGEVYQQFIKVAIEGAEEHNEKVLYIYQNLEGKELRVNFVVELNKYNSDSLSYIARDLQVNEKIEDLIIFIDIVMSNLSVSNIKSLLYMHRISEIISEISVIEKLYVYSLSNADGWNHFWNGGFDIKFDVVEQHSTSRECVRKIIENDMFMPSYDNISAICSILIGAEESVTPSYTNILKTRESSLLDKINQDINHYYIEVMKNNDDESLESMVLILNNVNLNDSFAEEIISNKKFVLEDLSAVLLDQYWPKIIIEGRLAPNWSNVILFWSNYWIQREYVKLIVDFLNDQNNYNALSKCSFPDDFDKSREFFHEVLMHKDINLNSVSAIIHVFPIPYDFLEQGELNYELWKVLVDRSVLDFRIGIFTNIKSVSENLAAQYLLNNWNVVDIKDISEHFVCSDFTYDLLSSNAITLTMKVKILDMIPDLVNATRKFSMLLSRLYISTLNTEVSFVIKSLLPLETMFDVHGESKERAKLAAAIIRNECKDFSDVKLVLNASHLIVFSDFYNRKKFTVENIPENIMLIEELDKMGLLGKIKYLEDTVQVNTRPTQYM